MRKANVKTVLVAGLLIFLAVTGMASEWQGYWGGEKGIWENPFYCNERIYPLGVPSYQKLLPELREYRMWGWEAPICYQFVDTTVHSWTEKEKEVARQAIDEWNKVPGPLQGRIMEKGEKGCLDREADILILWENKKGFFHNWGDPNGDGYLFNATGSVAIYVPNLIAPPFRQDPRKDLIAAGILERGSVIVLNLDNPSGWFVDPTPWEDEEFEKEIKSLCGTKQTVLKAGKGSPAYGKQDLFTVIAHEFGHALGLIHSGGCDGKPWTPRTYDLRDDDGSIMWGGPLTTRKSDLEDLFVGFNERRHVELRPVGKPDLIVTEITHKIEKECHPECEWTIEVYVTISNQGGAAAPPFWVQAIGSLGMGLIQIPGLAPGGNTTIKVVEATVKSKGMYMITAVADPTNIVEEENEENNTKTEMILIF